jgi:2-oxoglutarate ferredoxin oxidoreductase subunit delta
MICIDKEFCKGCGLCIGVCPQEVLKLSTERNPKGYLLPFAEAPEACVHCLLCESICPEMALYVEEDHAS